MLRYTLPICVLITGMISCGGDDEPNNTPPGCIDYSGVTGAGSLKDDVMPIFQTSCNFSACHGSNASSAMADLVLGPPSTDTPTQDEIDAVYNGIVGKAATQSSLNLVAAGDPAASYLMAKVEYSDVNTDCATTGCEDGNCEKGKMPPAGLDAAGIDTLRAWIKSGAPNN